MSKQPWPVWFLTETINLNPNDFQQASLYMNMRPLPGAAAAELTAAKIRKALVLQWFCSEHADLILTGASLEEHGVGEFPHRALVYRPEAVVMFARAYLIQAMVEQPLYRQYLNGEFKNADYVHQMLSDLSFAASGHEQTVSRFLETLQKRFDLKPCCLLGDEGMRECRNWAIRKSQDGMMT